MNLKINYNYIYILIFSFFFFFWGVNLNLIADLEFLNVNSEFRNFLSTFRLSYLIIILIIPILYSYTKKKTSLFKQIFNHQQNIFFLFLSVTIHFFFIKVYYQEIIDKSEIANLFYLLLLSIIYCHFRNFISLNFKKIVIFYLLIFISYSLYEGSQIYNFGFYDGDGVVQFTNLGQCNENIFLINVIREYLNIGFSNSIYQENSHLAMMTVAIFFASLYILIKEIKNSILFLLFSLLFILEIIIVLNNLSTTFFVAFIISQITLLLFFAKKITIKYWIITVIFLFLNSYLFLSDKNCTIKITDISVKDIAEERLQKGEKNMTTLIYQRSIIVAKKTLLNRSLGWGIDGMDNATINLVNGYKDCDTAKKWAREDVNDWLDVIDGVDSCNHRIPDNIGGHNDKDATFWLIKKLNLKDGLSNFLKLFTEFGIFSFIVYFYFLKYILNVKDVNSYNLFIIILFITLSIRGAGYFNGAYIFCILEFFYHKKFIENELKK